MVCYFAGAERETTNPSRTSVQYFTVELIEKSGRVCQALGIRQVNYTLAEVSYFLLLLIEFRIEIQKSNICQTCSVFRNQSRYDFQSISMASVTINPRVVDKLWELTNSASVFDNSLFAAPGTILPTAKVTFKN